MSNLTRYDPFELMSFRPSLGRFFNEPFFNKDFDFSTDGTLPLDVREEADGQLVVEASLPGFKKEDIDVEVANGQLTISAQRTQQDEEKRNGNKFHRKERYYGAVCRTIALPGVVDTKHVNAELKDGILKLRIPQAPEARSTKVKIS